MAKSNAEASSEGTSGPSKSSQFSKHAKEDSALKADQEDGTATERKGMTVSGRFAVFLGFPTLVGLFGLYTGYIMKRNDPTKELSFDIDFALPFMLALSFTLVIAYQTRGYTQDKPDPLVLWPKVKKRRKIVHKHVVVNPDGTEEEVFVDDEPAEENEKEEISKKND